MPNLVQIQDKTNEYSENLLPIESIFKHDNPVVNYSGNGTTDFMNEFSISKLTKSFLLDTIQDPVLGMQESFDFGNYLLHNCVKTGSYTFSFSFLSWNFSAPSSYSITLYLDVYKNGVNTESFPIEINKGNTTNFSFYTFYQSFILVQGENVNFKFRTESTSIGAPNPTIKWNFSGFKLEINDKIVSGQGFPTPFSMPVDYYLQENAPIIGVYDYNNSLAAQSFTGTEIVLNNNGLGAFTNKNYKLDNVNDIFNTTTNAFNFTGLELGDVVYIRLDLAIETTSPTQEIKIDMQLSQGSNPYRINFAHKSYKTAGTYTGQTFLMMVYIGNEETKNNPAQILFSSDANANVTVNGWAANVHKRLI